MNSGKIGIASESCFIHKKGIYKMKKRILSILLTVLMLVSLMLTAYRDIFYLRLHFPERCSIIVETSTIFGG